MKKQTKHKHAQKSSARPKAALPRRKPVEKTDVSWPSEENKSEGPDALSIHENGPVVNEVNTESK